MFIVLGEISIIHFYLQWILVFVCTPCKGISILTSRKSCCQLGSLIKKAKDAKDVVAYLTFGLKG